jgi:hypothetical protein
MPEVPALGEAPMRDEAKPRASSGAQERPANEPAESLGSQRPERRIGNEG